VKLTAKYQAATHPSGNDEGDDSAMACSG